MCTVHRLCTVHTQAPAAAPTPDPGPEADASDRQAVVFVLVGAGVVVSIMQTLMVPIIGQLPSLLGTSTANASWVITATLLFSAVVTPIMGRLGDLYGKRRMLFVCNGLLISGSILCALSSSLLPMVIGRALQGGGIPMIPLGISLMRDVVRPAKLGSSVALMSASLGVGGALGLPVAAVIVQYLDWHALFWFAAAAGVVFGVLIATVVPESHRRVPGTVDVVGMAGLAVGLCGYLVAVSKGGSWGWTSPQILTCATISAVSLAAWARWELRVGSPMVDLRTARLRPVLATNLAAVPVCLAMYTMSLTGPQILQAPEATGYGMGRSVLAAGLWMAPGGLVMLWVSRLAARLMADRGPRAALIAGALLIGGGNVAAQVLMGVGPVGILLFGTIISSGVAFTFAAMPSLIMASVPPTETAAANGFNALARSLGTSTASAMIGLVLGQMTMQFAGRNFPSEDGIRVVFAVGAAAAAVAVAVAHLIPRDTGRTPEVLP